MRLKKTFIQITLIIYHQTEIKSRCNFLLFNVRCSMRAVDR